MFKTFSEHFGLKIIALVSSILIWLYVGGEQNPVITRVVNAEVRARGAPPEKLLVRPSRDPIPVEVTGPKTEVDSIADNEIYAYVDLALAQEGERQLRVVEWRRPTSAAGVSLRPMRQFVDANIEIKLRKQFPITVSFNNEPPAGRVYGRPRLNPPRATVVGSHEDVRRVQKLTVYVETHGANVRTNATVQALDSDGVMIDTVSIEPATTRVDIDLTDAPARRTLPVAVGYRGQPAPPFTVTEVSSSPQVVTVVGKPERIIPLRNVPTGPVSLQGITQDTTLEVPLVLPDGVSVRDNPGTVRVTIRVKDASRPNP